MRLVRLRTITPLANAPRVDRAGSGRIVGASIIAAGPAIGHGFDIDGKTLDQVAKLAEGIPGRWTHGDLCADGLGTHLGRWRNVRREGDRVVGDFHFSESARNVRPAGLAVDAPTYLMDLAENEPDVAGVSAVLELADELELEDVGDAPRSFVRVERVARADYVADPAANPDGLFSNTPSALAERASVALSRACEAHGRPRVVTFLRSWIGEPVPNDALVAPAAPTSPPLPATGAALEAPPATVDLREHAALRAEVEALRAKAAAADAADVKRRADDVTAYLAGLRSQAAPNAIPEPELARVRSLLERGEAETAHLLGSLLLRVALGAAAPAGVIAPPSGVAEARRAVVTHQAEQLRAAGWTVVLSADGTQITTQTPPKREGR